LLTIEGWKPASELQTGSRIATPRKIGFFGNEFMSESQVKLLAFLIAEGHTISRAVLFTNFDEKIQKDFRKSVEDFDKRLEVKKMKNQEGQFRVINPNKKTKIIAESRGNGKFAKGIQMEKKNYLREWLISVGAYGFKAIEKTIPVKVFSLTEQKTALFLNRLFSCDGTIRREGNRTRIGYCSSSEKLIKQVQHLLLKFGIISTLRKKTIFLEGKKFESFEITIEGFFCKEFLDKIGFFGEKEKIQKIAQRDFAERKFNPNYDTIPKELWNQYTPENWAKIGRKIGYKHPKALRESTKYSPSRNKLLQIAIADENELVQLLAESDIYWDEIKSIEEINKKTKVFDISVPEGHNFVANDIIIHNSYTMSVFLEEFARLPVEVRQRISVITIDTVGIFWSLKIPNKENEEILSEWGLHPEATDIRVLVPKGKEEFYREKEVPIDGSFTLKASELDAVEWMTLFTLTWKDAEGVLISRVIETVREKMGTYYGIDDIISVINQDTESEKLTRQALVSRMKMAKTWGLIEKKGTKIMDIAKPGKITVIDVSSYRQSIGMEGTRDIIVAMLGKRLFEERMLYRKEEEMKLVKGQKKESSMPIIWMLIDEAHMFMPNDRPSIALQVLLEWVRVGRQPGLSLLLATQRPNKLHPDAISQCDLFISHRMTSKPDIEAVAALRPSYMNQDFDKYYAQMPRAKGFALVIDDNTEKIWMIKIRPRLSWDAGVTASAFLR